MASVLARNLHETEVAIPILRAPSEFMPTLERASTNELGFVE